MTQPHEPDTGRTEMPRGPQQTAAPGGPEDSGFPGATGEPPTQPTVGESAEPVSEPVSEPVGEPVGEPETSAGEGADQAVPEIEADLVNARSAVSALTDDLKRLQAEYVNYKRRVDRDRNLVKENATYSVLSSLMPVLDDLDRAREHGELEGGFKAIADSLERLVAAHGLVKFGRPGDEFDPRLHEAIMHAHSAEVTTTTCQSIVTAGYRLGERVVRPARVTVVDPEPVG